MHENMHDQPGLLRLHHQPLQRARAERKVEAKRHRVTLSICLPVVGSDYRPLLVPRTEPDADEAPLGKPRAESVLPIGPKMGSLARMVPIRNGCVLPRANSSTSTSPPGGGLF